MNFFHIHNYLITFQCLVAGGFSQGTQYSPCKVICFPKLTILVSHTDFMEADLVTSGNYYIEYCGHYANVIQNALQNTHDYLQQAIGSIDPTSPPYKAFLNGVDANDVKALFGRISAGNNLVVSGRSLRPTVICVNNKMDRLWDLCQSRTHSAMSASNTQWIFLCPIFWLVLIPKPQPSHCGRLNSAGTSISGPDIAQTQYTVLVHELTHLYLNKPDLKPEVYNLEDCLALPASQAAINPQSFSLYAGSKYSYL